MNDEYPDFLTRYFGEPIAPIPDCNNCKWLSITEFEQERVKRRSIVNEHACLLYGRRVFHRANTRRHDSFIFPCEECANDDYKYMKGEQMAKFEIEVEDCAHCPCLRNNEFGEVYCFYNSGHIIDPYYLNEIDEDCPLKGEE